MLFKDMESGEDFVKDVAELYVSSWRNTYKGILPDWYLDNMNVDKCIVRFNEYVKKKDQGIIMAMEENRLLGFSAYMPCEKIEGSILLEMLHVKREEQSKGVGKDLIYRTWDKVNKLGYKRMSISFMKKNTRAGNIYKHLGAEYVCDYTEKLDGVQFESELLVWTKMRFK